MSEKHQIYCFNNGGSPGWMIAMAMADDGHVLAEHVCSSEGFMPHDLGMDGSTWKHENYDKHFGAGNWELIWIDGSPKDNERVMAAYALNQKLSEEDKKKEDEIRTHVTIETDQGTIKR